MKTLGKCRTRPPKFFNNLILDNIPEKKTSEMLKFEDFAMKTFGKLSSTHTKKVLVVTHGFETFLDQNANFMMLIY